MWSLNTVTRKKMTNNLNTAMLEGSLKTNPKERAEHKCELTISNHKYVLKDGKYVKETSVFSVLVDGKTADTCLQILRKGSNVRVVGRLNQIVGVIGGVRHEKVYLMAEHIEFRPKGA